MFLENVHLCGRDNFFIFANVINYLQTEKTYRYLFYKIIGILLKYIVFCIFVMVFTVMILHIF